MSQLHSPHAPHTHPRQDEVHFQLGQPPAHAGPDPHPKRDGAVGVVLGPRGAPPQPALGEKPFGLGKLCIVMARSVVAQVELCLRGGEKERDRERALIPLHFDH